MNPTKKIWTLCAAWPYAHTSLAIELVYVVARYGLLRTYTVKIDKKKVLKMVSAPSPTRSKF